MTSIECKKCGFKAGYVETEANLRMMLKISHNGREFRQSGVRLLGSDLESEMKGVKCICPNCGKSGEMHKGFEVVKTCRACGRTPAIWCSYNGGVYCTRCYESSILPSCLLCSERVKGCKLFLEHEDAFKEFMKKTGYDKAINGEEPTRGWTADEIRYRINDTTYTFSSSPPDFDEEEEY